MDDLRSNYMYLVDSIRLSFIPPSVAFYYYSLHLRNFPICRLKRANNFGSISNQKMNMIENICFCLVWLSLIRTIQNMILSCSLSWLFLGHFVSHSSCFCTSSASFSNSANTSESTVTSLLIKAIKFY